MSKIHFKAKHQKIATWNIIRLPESASLKLTSRGMVMVDGTINGIYFKEALEPDGLGCHWFRVKDDLLTKAGIDDDDDIITLVIEQSDVWIEPEIPSDLKKAFVAHPDAHSLWKRITPNARWEWIRWIRATRQPETRQRRINIACAKLNAGTRRPCCFNRNMCTEPAVSHNWILLQPTH